MNGLAVYTLQTPQRLELQIEGKTWYGFCQDWYRDDFRRRAGCGPTTAAYMLAYCLLRDGVWHDFSDVESALRYMDRVWDYVTPRHGGLFKTRWLKEGTEEFLAAHGIEGYRVHSLPVSALSLHRPSAAELEGFIIAGLAADSPVAFLNRHRGKEPELETWHWVPLVEYSTETEAATATCYDEGGKCRFVPARWLKDTILGGGFVYMEKVK